MSDCKLVSTAARLNLTFVYQCEPNRRAGNELSTSRTKVWTQGISSIDVKGSKLSTHDSHADFQTPMAKLIPIHYDADVCLEGDSLDGIHVPKLALRTPFGPLSSAEEEGTGTGVGSSLFCRFWMSLSRKD